MGNFCGRPIRMLFLHRLDLLASNSAANIHIFFDTWCLWDKVLFKCKESSTLKNGRMTWNGIAYPWIHFQCQWNTLARHSFSCTPKLHLCLDKLISLTSKNLSSDFREPHTNCTFAVGSLKVRYFNATSTVYRHYFDTFRVLKWRWSGVKVVTVERRNSGATVDWHVSFGGEWWEARRGFVGGFSL